MRIAALTLAALGLAWLSTSSVTAQQQPASVPITPAVAVAADQVVITPVKRKVIYRSGPIRYEYHYNYRAPHPRTYWYAPPRYRAYYYEVPRGRYYYYPYGYRFEYYGPRRTIHFGF